jgi:hypothetical protein
VVAIDSLGRAGTPTRSPVFERLHEKPCIDASGCSSRTATTPLEIGTRRIQRTPRKLRRSGRRRQLVRPGRHSDAFTGLRILHEKPRIDASCCSSRTATTPLEIGTRRIQRTPRKLRRSGRRRRLVRPGRLSDAFTGFRKASREAPHRRVPPEFHPWHRDTTLRESAQPSEWQHETCSSTTTSRSPSRPSYGF